MKKLLVIVGFVCLLAACNDSKVEEPKVEGKTVEEIMAENDYVHPHFKAFGIIPEGSILAMDKEAQDGMLFHYDEEPEDKDHIDFNLYHNNEAEKTCMNEYFSGAELIARVMTYYGNEEDYEESSAKVTEYSWFSAGQEVMRINYEKDGTDPSVSLYYYDRESGEEITQDQFYKIMREDENWDRRTISIVNTNLYQYVIKLYGGGFVDLIAEDIEDFLKELHPYGLYLYPKFDLKPCEIFVRE